MTEDTPLVLFLIFLNIFSENGWMTTYNLSLKTFSFVTPTASRLLASRASMRVVQGCPVVINILLEKVRRPLK